MDKEQLFKPRLAEAEVELDGMGTVRVRALSRGEVIAVRTAADNDPATLDGKRVLVLERKMVAKAMLDPVLTEAEVRRWQDAAPAGELTPVTDKIQELSGMDDAAAKRAVKELAADSDAEFRDVPGSEAVDDGEPDARGDAEQ